MRNYGFFSVYQAETAKNRLYEPISRTFDRFMQFLYINLLCSLANRKPKVTIRIFRLIFTRILKVRSRLSASEYYQIDRNTPVIIEKHPTVSKFIERIQDAFLSK